MPAERTQECGNCRFFINAQCQRYPEAIAVSEDYWCGEWSEGPFPKAPEPSGDPDAGSEAGE